MFPIPVALTAFYIADATPRTYELLALLPVTILTALTCLPLLSTKPRIRWWSTLAPLAIAALSALWFIYAQPHGLKHQSLTHVLTCDVIALICPAALVALYTLNRRYPTFKTKIAFHALTTLWLASYAFPYLGELP